MVLVVICYLCFVRVKRKWWDQIPSPAKSKVAENMTVKPVSFVRKVCSAVEGKQHLQDTHKLDSQSKIDVTFCSQPTRGKVPKNSPGGKQEVFLTPEVTVVEYPVLIYRHESDAKPEAPEAEADWVPHEDAVARLFRVLLSGELSMGGTSILEPLAQEEQSPTEGQAPERMPSAVGLWQDVPLGKPQGSLESSSESGYRSSSTEAATSSRAASPDPEQLLGHGLCPSAVQPSVLLLPPHESDHAFATVRIGPLEEGSSAVPSGYKCFNSFVSEPLANFSQLLPPQWEGNPEAPPQNAPGKADTLPCPVAALLSGYRSFSSALQSSPKSPQGRRSSSSLDLQSPYKPLQSCQEQPPTNSPCGQNPFSPRLGGPGDPAWPRAPWEADLGMRESTAGGGFKRGAARDRGLLCP
ncbi:uncharacterized protein LOC133371938 [Rhineura floridana]|nr:uncharacterized protein LOC133371938 [Rhineura floridana]